MTIEDAINFMYSGHNVGLKPLLKHKRKDKSHHIPIGKGKKKHIINSKSNEVIYL